MAKFLSSWNSTDLNHKIFKDANQTGTTTSATVRTTVGYLSRNVTATTTTAASVVTAAGRNHQARPPPIPTVKPPPFLASSTVSSLLVYHNKTNTTTTSSSPFPSITNDTGTSFNSSSSGFRNSTNQSNSSLSNLRIGSANLTNSLNGNLTNLVYYNGDSVLLDDNAVLRDNRSIGGDKEAEEAAAFDTGNNFMLLLDEFSEYFYNYNGTPGIPGQSNSNNFTSSYDFPANCSLYNSTCGVVSEVNYNYWALILILFPFFTLFGNVLVILSVCRERTLQTVTNYFIVSLAIADLLVAVVVMPFGVYILVNGAWSLPNMVCDFYIAMDVICSTSSIFNLVAISIDRYIAVTQPIKYAKHKNSRRVCLTILLVWAISAAIGSPIVLGLNNTPDRVPDLCVFYNSDFIVYSSLSSFYIPCIIMVFLYWNIFKALRNRAKKQRAARKSHLSDLTTGGSVIENVAQTRKLAETQLDSSKSGSKILPDEERPTNTASGSNEEEDDNAGSPDVDDCHVIINDKSTEFILATVVEEAGNVMAQIASPHLPPKKNNIVNSNNNNNNNTNKNTNNNNNSSNNTNNNVTSANTITTPQIDPNGNHDSGYAPSNVDDIVPVPPVTPPGSPRMPIATVIVNRGAQNAHPQQHHHHHRNGSQRSPKKEQQLSVAMRPLSFMRSSVQDALSLARNDSTLSTNSRGSRKDKKNSQASRFTIYKVHKASKKKREKSSAKKERKATKTLAIVLGVFLICWVPFFTCNIMDAMCVKLDMDCQPGVTVFILTTWLGYMNSFVNPVIYTIFNPEFRKAFKKIMHLGN